MSGLGSVSRVTPVQTALRNRNCTGDEGRPFGFGDQVADSKPPQAAVAPCTHVDSQARRFLNQTTTDKNPRKRNWNRVGQLDRRRNRQVRAEADWLSPPSRINLVCSLLLLIKLCHRRLPLSGPRASLSPDLFGVRWVGGLLRGHCREYCRQACRIHLL